MCIFEVFKRKKKWSSTLKFVFAGAASWTE